MNLSKALTAAGIGCGKNCACKEAFIGTLDSEQKELLAHMIEQGAKKHLKKIKKANKLKRRESPSPKRGDNPLLDMLFGNFPNTDKRRGQDPFTAMMLAALLSDMHQSAVEPYVGELTEDQMSKLAEAPEKLRQVIENGLREAITKHGGGDPARVMITDINEMGMGIKIVKTNPGVETATDDSGAADTENSAAA